MKDSDYYKAKYPNLPVYAYPAKKGKAGSKTNELTDAIIRHIKAQGGTAYRVNSQGQYDSKLGKWRLSGMKRGLPDIIGIYEGRFLGVEVKTGRDKLSEYQLKRKQEIETSKGIYIETKTLQQFEEDFKSICNQTSRKC